MVLPPGVPMTSAVLPSRTKIVGVIDESIRLPGAMALLSLPITPNLLGTPVLALKSSISLFIRKPAPPTTTPEPNSQLSV